MKARQAVVGAALLALFLAAAGCGSTCEDACAQVARACADDFTATGMTLEASVCEANCESAYDECPVRDEGLSCLEAAASCADAFACATCAERLPLAVTFAGCALACRTVEAVCAADYAALGATLDPVLCAHDCVEGVVGCSNAREQLACTSAAPSCAEAGRCPPCAP